MSSLPCFHMLPRRTAQICHPQTRTSARLTLSLIRNEMCSGGFRPDHSHLKFSRDYTLRACRRQHFRNILCVILSCIILSEVPHLALLFHILKVSSAYVGPDLDYVDTKFPRFSPFLQANSRILELNKSRIPFYSVIFIID